MKKPERLARTTIYENPWVNLHVDRVLFPNGRLIEKHHVLDFDKEAVAVIVENGAGEILLVQAYRYITNTIEWEIPGGTMEPGETVLEAAARETYEESGYETTNHQLIYTYHPMNGIANQIFHVVTCQSVAQTGQFDRNEIKSLKWVTKTDIRDMIKRHKMRDGFSLTAVLLHCL